MVFRIVSLIALIGLTVFLSISVGSYHPLDNSPFFYSTSNDIVHNHAGTVGAYVAAWLLYMCGGVASIWLILSLFLVIYLLLQKKSLLFEWERIFACGVIFFAMIALAALHNNDVIVAATPGGFLGKTLINWIQEGTSQLLWKLFFYTSLVSSLVVLERFYLVIAVRHYLEIAHAKGMSLGVYRWVTMLFVWLIHGFRIAKSGVFFVRDQAYFWYHGSVVKQDVNIACARVLKEFLNEIKQPTGAQSFVDPESTGSPHISENVVPLTDLKKEELEAELSKQSSKSYELPSVSAQKRAAFLEKQRVQDQQERAKLLEEKLKRFGVTGSIVSIKSGPVVTVFEYQPHIDTKLSKIISLEDDLALALSAMSVRIIAPIPGTAVVGFEVANQKRTDVLFSHIIAQPEYREYKGALPIVLGEDTIGQLSMVDLSRMPHLLVAGSTGSGKSVALNGMLISLLCKKTPDEMKLILIDPKRLEFSAYADIAHLLFPIVVNPKQAVLVLQWVAKTMEARYEKMAAYGARNIYDYNEAVSKIADKEQLPFIVVCIDELSDLMLTAGREIEVVITRIAQMARAAGIHLIVATQRPSVDVITGLIKVNFPSRISFRVTSRGDSRTILDNIGAERLLGRGDMLFLDATSAQVKRIHGAFVSDEEIKQVIQKIRKQRVVSYLDLHEELATISSLDEDGENNDTLYNSVVQFVQESSEVSISLLQRKFRIGYNRSARMIEKLEAQGLIMPPDGTKTRKVIR